MWKVALLAYDEIAKVRGWIEREWRPWIVERAREHLDRDSAHAVLSVLNHWRRLAAEPPVTP
jgi:hypothetical protein